MPRINIEDKLWGEERFQDLLIKVQNRHVAKGMILEAILLAQRYWCSVTSPRQCIPVDEFNKLGLKPLLEVNLAKITDTGIYLCGSEDHFSWWFQRVEAGRSGGIAKSSNAKRNLAGAKQNVPSSSSSSSSSCSISSSNKKTNIEHSSKEVDLSKDKSPKEKVDSKEIVKTKQTWQFYENAFKGRYGVLPERNPKTNSQMKQFVERVGIDNAPHIAAFYLTHNDSFYIKQCHVVGMLLKDAEKLATEWKTGNKMTSQRAYQMERTQNNLDACNAVLKEFENGKSY